MALRSERRPPVIDAVVPARDEAPTVASVVEACLGCRAVREVLVVDDGSVDDTAERAAAAGAKVLRRGEPGAPGSKAKAMELGVAASDADAFLFVDADLRGLTSDHLDALCRPFLEGRAAMAVGWFDYGALNPLVLRLPPTTGERVLPRFIFEAVPPALRAGYTIELLLDGVVAEARLRTSAQVMHGVTHRTKREKFGKLEGYRRTWRMFAEIMALPLTGVVRWRTYWFYLRGLTIEPPHPTDAALPSGSAGGFGGASSAVSAPYA